MRRAGRWATWQVGKHGRTVTEVAADLGADWHTVNDAVIAYGSVLVDDPDRIGDVVSLGLDETLFTKTGKWRTKQWSTSIVDVAGGRLLDVIEGRDALPAVRWLANRDQAWRDQVGFATLDMSGPYRKVFDTMLPDAVQVADPFHLVRLAGEKLDEVRRPSTTGAGGSATPACWWAACCWCCHGAFGWRWSVPSPQASDR